MSQNHVFINPEIEYSYRYAVNGTHAKVVHGHDFYEFFLTLNDGVLHHINGKEQILHDDMLVFIRPQDEHYFAPMGNIEPRHINLAFRMDIVDALFLYLGKRGENLKKQLLEPSMPPVCVLTEREKRRVIESLNSFSVIDPEEIEERKLYLRFFIAEVFSMFAQKLSHETNEKSDIPSWLENACDKMCLHENFSEGLTRMVELSGKTREHLARSMQRYKNITVSAYINNLRLEYVANMLVNSDLSIVDLCYESGFSSLDYFGKQFKKKYGMAPSKFRIIMKKESI